MSRSRDHRSDPEPDDIRLDSDAGRTRYPDREPAEARPRYRGPDGTPVVRFRGTILEAAWSLLEGNRGLFQASASAHGPDGRVYTAHARRESRGDPRSWIADGAPDPPASGPAESAEVLRERMGRYVTELLSAHCDLAALPWPLAVTWNEHKIAATVTRGSLTLRAEAGKFGWWDPQRKSVGQALADSIATVVAAKYARVADADETGRCRSRAWRGRSGLIRGRSGIEAGERPVALVLEPGVYMDWTHDRQRYLAWRVDEAVAPRTPEEALAEGWIRVVEGPGV